MYIILNAELYHHGIKGQKWGIRRYQNYDGSYTRAGMKRYYAAKEQYDKAHDRTERAKQAYKENKTGDNKIELANARIAEKRSKSALNKQYKQLKQDKLADQGKELYSKGKTITSSSKSTKVLSEIAAMSSAILAARIKKREELERPASVSEKKWDAILSATIATTGGASAVKKLKDNYEAKRLRAYYSHSLPKNK